MKMRLKSYLLILFGTLATTNNIVLSQPQGFVLAQLKPNPIQSDQSSAASGGGDTITNAGDASGIIDKDDLSPAAANYRPQQQYEYEEEEDDDLPAVPIVRQPITHHHQQQQQPQQQQQQHINRRQQQQQQQNQQSQYVRKGGQTNKEILEELEEQEEPDRLAQLLEKSDFKCEGRTGYYADEGLNCEVFHYCQENQKHSWICPEGFSFHQIHLICMPPASDNICEQSSKYHVVNDYLYKALNMEEHQSKPNVTLRYSERYYPEDFYHDERQDRQEYQERPRQPLQVGLRKPQAPIGNQYQQRQPYQQQQQQQQQQNVYRTPEEINISLQQRRPQLVFAPTTTRYEQAEEQEYNYEK